MKRAATLLALAVLLAFSAAQMAASTGQRRPSRLLRLTISNQRLLDAAPSNTALNFTVTDVQRSAVDLRQAAGRYRHLQRLHPGAGPHLDDLMTSIVQAIRAEQKKVNAEEK